MPADDTRTFAFDLLNTALAGLSIADINLRYGAGWLTQNPSKDLRDLGDRLDVLHQSVVELREELARSLGGISSHRRA